MHAPAGGAAGPAGQALAELGRLPRTEQLARLAAYRDAKVDCDRWLAPTRG
ncbi:hypothetical protein ACN28C_31285 [Plantactinospora sp. WMMC1484]|uniref:hypothetical protein n=1 Tax=Plantactinospora sp. WMMC1484 TaxID=3404122 RepID=UPI003BF600C2